MCYSKPYVYYKTLSAGFFLGKLLGRLNQTFIRTEIRLSLHYLISGEFHNPSLPNFFKRDLLSNSHLSTLLL